MDKINIFIAGHNGMVGSAIFSKLSLINKVNIIVRDKKTLDLTNQNQVKCFFSENKIDQVYLCAAKVGGIHANNSYPADFLYDNLMIQSNVIKSSFDFGIKKLLFLGSSCIYPRITVQPMKEDQLLSGYLEKTNEAYAVAKISGLKLCESINRQYKDLGIDYRSVMPTNLYGPGDNYDLNNSHVIPALIKKIHLAKINDDKIVNVWGDGSPLREFLHVSDLADACIFIMNLDIKKLSNLVHINVGSGQELSIKKLAAEISSVIGFKGKIDFDETKPNGTPRKLLDSSVINNLGWFSKISLKQGLINTYKEFLNYEK
jgi:GDP-L-fucose synthase